MGTAIVTLITFLMIGALPFLIGLVILYFIIKWGVKEGTYEALKKYNVMAKRRKEMAEEYENAA